MCGIGGIVGLHGPLSEADQSHKAVFDELLAHRGPDGSGVWCSRSQYAQFFHYRLAVIDTSASAQQPMTTDSECTVTFNGEIYNYRELRETARSKGRHFKSRSDTETILSTYELKGSEMMCHLRGMFAFALWDESSRELFLVRDRFGIKPLYFCVTGDKLFFASEVKALLPFLRSVTTNYAALAEYLTFQYTIGGQTLFQGIEEVPPGHYLRVRDGKLALVKYWDVQYQIMHGKSNEYFESSLRELLNDSISVHLRSDVEVGAYVSGGFDSSLIYSLASQQNRGRIRAFHGRFDVGVEYDESAYAAEVVKMWRGPLEIRSITAHDFAENIRKVIFHLDQPAAGPGAFAQYMVSELASRQVKVVLGGQGGDEIFGGYARYLIAYFEQCIKAAIEDTYNDGNFVVTLESIIPNLRVLQEYKPLIQEFWQSGIFGPLDQRFFRLVNRTHDFLDEIDWSLFDLQSVFARFVDIFNNRANVRREAYFDKMTHFEFKTLLPALLQVEDRMSMAHGIESRVPFLDHPLVEFMATVPADVKFKDGRLKNLLKSTFKSDVPNEVFQRRDKMGFPVPLSHWFSGELRDFFYDITASMEAKSRPGFNARAIRKNFEQTGKFSRKTWALLSLELWHQQFHDRADEFRALAKRRGRDS